VLNCLALRNLLAIVIWLAPLAGPASASGAIYLIRWNTDAGQTAVEVSGLTGKAFRKLRAPNWQTEDWHNVLSVYAGRGESDADLPPMMGSYSVADGLIRFLPKFPLERGVAYRAVFRPSRLPADADPRDKDLVSTFRLQGAQRQSRTVVTRIYPTSSVLPENLLKFYLYFSAPMRRGNIYEHIHLLDEAEKPVELPFLEIGEELWNPEFTRLTLIIDPGRIKRGVQPLEEIGPVLQSGKNYTLVIDRGWQDADGNPLKEGYRKPFKTGPALRQPIDTATWKITSPPAGSRVALSLRFPEPLDHALAARMIRVSDKGGAAVAGAATMSDEERLWSFIPANAWAAGKYQLTIQTTIEDLAGNNIGKAFDVDLFDRAEQRIHSVSVSLNFETK
jgi:hypothetical protein